MHIQGTMKSIRSSREKTTGDIRKRDNTDCLR